jgi:predicted nuclease with TOPRIM domain
VGPCAGLQVLNNLKEQLIELVQDGQALRQDICSRQQELQEFDTQFSTVKKDRSRAQHVCRRLKLEQEDV